MTDRLSRKLHKLDDFLLSDAVDEEGMLLSELDGFLTGVIVSPDMILPSEWLPLIWGDEEPEFENERQAKEIIDTIMGHYNTISRELHQRRYRPIYHLDTDDSFFWEIWMEGFQQAFLLAPTGWAAFDENPDEKLQNALFVLYRLMELATFTDVEPLEFDDELRDIAADIIPSQVEILHHARLSLQNPGERYQTTVRVGRNDPCPCGSGKKYKKCCLQ